MLYSTMHKIPPKIQKMAEVGHIAYLIREETAAYVKPGRSTLEIDRFAKRLMDEYGVTSLSYGASDEEAGVETPFPGYICVSLNDEVTHGIGRSDVIIQDGDMVSIDVAVQKDGWCGDNCTTVVAGKPSKAQAKLMDVTYEAMQRGIASAKTGARVGDISHAIQSFAQSEGFSVVRDLAGHGIGQNIWEEPMVPNFGKPKTGPKLKEFQTIALDTMLNEGGSRVVFDPFDKWTVRTADGKNACVFEETFYVSKEGGVVLTK